MNPAAYDIVASTPTSPKPRKAHSFPLFGERVLHSDHPRLDPRRALAWIALVALASVATLISACGAQVDEEAEGSQQSAVAVAGRWRLPEDVRAAGAAVSLRYESGPAWNGGSSCSGGLRAGSRVLGEFVGREFTAVTTVGGYSCRRNTANSARMSVHGTGRALDIMLPLASGGQADNGRGDAIANWLVKNAADMGVQLIIWDRTVWRSNGSNDGSYSGPHPHHDHVHVELTSEGAAGRMPWFENMTGLDDDDAGASMMDAGTDDDPLDDDDEDMEPKPDAGMKDAGGGIVDGGGGLKDAGSPTPTPTPTPEEEELGEEPGDDGSNAGVEEGDDDGPALDEVVTPTNRRSGSSSSDGPMMDNAGCSAAGTSTPSGGAAAALAAGLALATVIARRRTRR